VTIRFSKMAMPLVLVSYGEIQLGFRGD